MTIMISRLVTHSNLREDDYSVISPQGITRVRDDEAEFTEIEQWKREYAHYKKLIKAKNQKISLSILSYIIQVISDSHLCTFP